VSQDSEGIEVGVEMEVAVIVAVVAVVAVVGSIDTPFAELDEEGIRCCDNN
jgi:hypothetical protein